MSKAFTMLEILVVITIIIVLSAIGIGNYRSTKINLTIDLETDKVVAFLQSAREETRAIPNCIEVVFKKNETPQKREGVYKNPVQGCDFSNKTPISFQLSSDIIPASSIRFLFIPPKGDMQVTPKETEEIRLVSKNNIGLYRTISWNTRTGRIEKSN